MKIVRIIILTILACLLFSYTASLAQKETPQDQTPQKELNYIEIIRQGYTTAETSKITIESWKLGILNDYGLIFDHLEMTYEGIVMAPTTDEKTLVCGNLLIIGYGRTSDGDKKRVISLRSVCHLFNKEVVEKALTMAKEPNRVLNGWDDSVLI
jgi:hypothetical protein